MRKLAILTFQTLDGVMQAPSVSSEDFSGEFNQGGWANKCWDEVMVQVGREAMAEPYDLLLGRTTYNIFVSSFANSDIDSPVAKTINSAKKFVVTSREGELLWQNSEKITGDIIAEVSKLKKQNGPLIQIHGSWQLIQALLPHNLIDELRLWTFPVVIGSGKRLFGEGAVPGNYRLIKFEACPSGAFMSFYQPK